LGRSRAVVVRMDAFRGQGMPDAWASQVRVGLD
jgi:hypothetical protein